MIIGRILQAGMYALDVQKRLSINTVKTTAENVDKQKWGLQS